MSHRQQQAPSRQVPIDAAWLEGLIDAVTVQAVSEQVLTLAGRQSGCQSARLIWMDELPDAATAISADQRVFARSFLNSDEKMQARTDGLRWAFRLSHDLAVVLLIDFRIHPLTHELQSNLLPALLVAGRHLAHVLELEKLRGAQQQLERSEHLQQALFAISELAGSDRDMSDLLCGIHGIIRQLMYAENFYIVRYDAVRQTVHFLYFVDTVDLHGPDTACEMPLESRRGSLTWHLLTTGKSLMGSPQELDAQVNGTSASFGPESVDWLGVPMVRNGEVQGALVVQSYRPGMEYSENDRTLLTFVANHILAVLERKRTMDDQERRVRQRTQQLDTLNRELRQKVIERQHAVQLQVTLFQLAQLATSDLAEEDFYAHVHAAVGQLLESENFFIALVSDDSQRLEFPYYVDGGVRRETSRPLGRGISEYVLRRGSSWLGSASDIEALSRAGEMTPVTAGKPPACWLGVPLRVDEIVIGLVAVQSYKSDSSYGEADRDLLEFVAMQIANSIYRRRAATALQHANARLEQRVAERTRELHAEVARREKTQQQLRHQVLHDTLTGLPNRTAMREQLERRLAVMQNEIGRHCVLMYLDVDRFKLVNDTLGHLAGDAFLQVIAQRLRYCINEPDISARLSGDEFAILIEDVANTARVEEIAQRVMSVLCEPTRIAGKELEPSVSMGIAVGDSSYTDADALLHDADIALYRAKELGRKRYAIFDKSLTQVTVDIFTLGREIRHALQHGEFEPYFQPILSLADGQVVGYEALLRWNHPSRGLLAPNDFLRVAQDFGYLEEIDWFLFGRAFECFLALNTQGRFLTINVSPLHLRHPDFDQRLLSLLDRSGIEREQLVIEVTEGALLDDTERVRTMLERLDVAGVRAALDDFGTGYSSLSYLHTLPLHKLKIDQSFVHSLNRSAYNGSNAVVGAILALGRALDLFVVAEGIETVAQRDQLLAMGCQYGQGFLLGAPAPLAHWLTGAGFIA